MAKRNGTVPELPLRSTRAGFIPGGWEESGEVELWQVWLRSSDGERGKRASFKDMRSMGFKPSKKAWG